MMRSFVGPVTGFGGSGSFGCSLATAAGGRVVAFAVATLGISGFALAGGTADEFFPTCVVCSELFPTLEGDGWFFVTGVVAFGSAAIGAGFVAGTPLAMIAAPCVPFTVGVGIAFVVARVAIGVGGTPASSFAGFVFFAADFVVGLAESLSVGFGGDLAMAFALTFVVDVLVVVLSESRLFTFTGFVLTAAPRDSAFRSSSLLMASQPRTPCRRANSASSFFDRSVSGPALFIFEPLPRALGLLWDGHKHPFNRNGSRIPVRRDVRFNLFASTCECKLQLDTIPTIICDRLCKAVILKQLQSFRL